MVILILLTYLRYVLNPTLAFQSKHFYFVPVIIKYHIPIERICILISYCIEMTSKTNWRSRTASPDKELSSRFGSVSWRFYGYEGLLQILSLENVANPALHKKGYRALE